MCSLPECLICLPSFNLSFDLHCMAHCPSLCTSRAWILILEIRSSLVRGSLSKTTTGHFDCFEATTCGLRRFYGSMYYNLQITRQTRTGTNWKLTNNVVHFLIPNSFKGVLRCISAVAKYCF